MPGITTAHLLPHFEIRILPEPSEITRHLYRAVTWRQQLQGKRDSSIQQARCVGPSEELLQTDCQHRRFRIRVVDCYSRPRRHLDMRRGELVELRLGITAGHTVYGEKNTLLLEIDDTTMEV